MSYSQDKFKVSLGEFAVILSEFTLNIFNDSNFKSVFNKKNEDFDFNRECIIFYMFIITFVCRKNNFPNKLLDLYHIKMYDEITARNIIPTRNIIPKMKGELVIHMRKDTLVSALFEEKLNERYKTYYKCIKYLNDDNGVWEIGKMIVNNFGCDINDPELALKAGSDFIISIKHISKYLSKFDLENSM